MAREAPPTRYRFFPGAARSTAAGASARSAASEIALTLSPSSVRRSGPSGRVMPWPICRFSPVPGEIPAPIRTNSTLPPPRSPTSPSASGIPASTPAADNRASSAPSRILTGTRHWRSTSSAKGRPSVASRTAAVAKTARCLTPRARASATNRDKLASASAVPSGFRRPVEAIPRPRAHMTFSLRRGKKVPPNRSKTTSLSEFEPRSTTAMRPAVAVVSGSVISSANEKPRLAPLERLAAPRQARVGHKVGVRREGFIIDCYALVVPIRRQAPTLQGIPEVGYHNLVQHLAVHRLVLYRHERLDASVKISRHPVGRADRDLGSIRRQLLAAGETDDTAMLEETADDAFHSNIVRKPWDAGAQAADAADHEVDTHPRL